MVSANPCQDILDPEKILRLRNIRDQVRLDLTDLGINQGDQYFSLQIDQKNPGLHMLGLDDETSAYHAQATLIANIDNANSFSRGVCGNHWSVWTGIDLGELSAPTATLDEVISEDSPPSIKFIDYTDFLKFTDYINTLLRDSGIYQGRHYANLREYPTLAGIEIDGIESKNMASAMGAVIVEDSALPFVSITQDEDLIGIRSWRLVVYSTLSNGSFDRTRLLSCPDINEYIQTAQVVSGFDKFDTIKEAELQIGYGLVKYMDVARGGNLFELFKINRTELGQNGINLPAIHVKDTIPLKAMDFQIGIGGNVINGTVDDKDRGAEVLATAVRNAVLDYQF